MVKFGFRRSRLEEMRKATPYENLRALGVFVVNLSVLVVTLARGSMSVEYRLILFQLGFGRVGFRSARLRWIRGRRQTTEFHQTSH